MGELTLYAVGRTDTNKPLDKLSTSDLSLSSKPIK